MIHMWYTNVVKICTAIRQEETRQGDRLYFSHIEHTPLECTDNLHVHSWAKNVTPLANREIHRNSPCEQYKKKDKTQRSITYMVEYFVACFFRHVLYASLGTAPKYPVFLAWLKGLLLCPSNQPPSVPRSALITKTRPGLSVCPFPGGRQGRIDGHSTPPQVSRFRSSGMGLSPRLAPDRFYTVGTIQRGHVFIFLLLTLRMHFRKLRLLMVCS